MSSEDAKKRYRRSQVVASDICRAKEHFADVVHFAKQGDLEDFSKAYTRLRIQLTMLESTLYEGKSIFRR